MATLPGFACPYCGQLIISRECDVPIKAPRSYAECLRQCRACEVGFSNANSRVPTDLTPILREPFAGIPDTIAAGWQDVLAQALNVKNRKTKQARMSSLHSEDHVTWTVFRYLQLNQFLRSAFSGMALKEFSSSTEEPTLLLWGVPVPLNDTKGEQLHRELCAVLSNLKENPEYHSEPDVILDFGKAGLLLIEVKLKSGNEAGEANGRWDKYLANVDPSCLPFSNSARVRQSGLYELTRNWRIAWELAKDRPMALVNLGLERLFTEKGSASSLQQFREGLSQSSTRQFLPLTWNQLVNAIPYQEEWFKVYVVKRGINSAGTH